MLTKTKVQLLVMMTILLAMSSSVITTAHAIVWQTVEAVLEHVITKWLGNSGVRYLIGYVIQTADGKYVRGFFVIYRYIYQYGRWVLDKKWTWEFTKASIKYLAALRNILVTLKYIIASKLITIPIVIIPSVLPSVVQPYINRCGWTCSQILCY